MTYILHIPYIPCSISGSCSGHPPPLPGAPLESISTVGVIVIDIQHK